MGFVQQLSVTNSASRHRARLLAGLPVIEHLRADLPPHDVPPGAPALCRPEPCEGGGQTTANHVETLEKTFDAMDRDDIVKAFLSGVDPGIVQHWARFLRLEQDASGTRPSKEEQPWKP